MVNRHPRQALRTNLGLEDATPLELSPQVMGCRLQSIGSQVSSLRCRVLTLCGWGGPHGEAGLADGKACRVHEAVVPAYRRAFPVHEGALPPHGQAVPVHEGPLPTHERALPTYGEAFPVHEEAVPVHSGTLPTYGGTLPKIDSAKMAHKLAAHGFWAWSHWQELVPQSFAAKALKSHVFRHEHGLAGHRAQIAAEWKDVMAQSVGASGRWLDAVI
jgi:hypothetical protein